MKTLLGLALRSAWNRRLTLGLTLAAVALSSAVVPYFARLMEHNLRDVPRGVLDMGRACRASTSDMVFTLRGGSP